MTWCASMVGAKQRASCFFFLRLFTIKAMVVGRRGRRRRRRRKWWNGGSTTNGESRLRDVDRQTCAQISAQSCCPRPVACGGPNFGVIWSEKQRKKRVWWWEWEKRGTRNRVVTDTKILVSHTGFQNVRRNILGQSMRYSKEILSLYAKRYTLYTVFITFIANPLVHGIPLDLDWIPVPMQGKFPNFCMPNQYQTKLHRWVSDCMGETSLKRGIQRG